MQELWETAQTDTNTPMADSHQVYRHIQILEYWTSVCSHHARICLSLSLSLIHMHVHALNDWPDDWVISESGQNNAPFLGMTEIPPGIIIQKNDLKPIVNSANVNLLSCVCPTTTNHANAGIALIFHLYTPSVMVLSSRHRNTLHLHVLKSHHQWRDHLNIPHTSAQSSTQTPVCCSQATSNCFCLF